MFEVEKNGSLEVDQLAELFARCGWAEEEAGVKLEWALASSAEWVVCRYEGEVVGFGRSCRLGPLERVLFDVVVDPRFDVLRVKAEILRWLTQDVSGFEQVSVFAPSAEDVAYGPRPEPPPAFLRIPVAPVDAYLGVKPKDSRRSQGGAE